jgi:hypothetical protein
MEWHREKEGVYPKSTSNTPVWVKDKDEWKTTPETWPKLTDALKNRGRDFETEATSIHDFKIMHRLHDRPSVTDEYLHNVIKWHKEKEGRYPSESSLTPVWLKNEEGQWSTANDSWNLINNTMTVRSLRNYTSYKSLASFKAAHGYSNSRSAVIQHKPT